MTRDFGKYPSGMPRSVRSWNYRGRAFSEEEREEIAAISSDIATKYNFRDKDKDAHLAHVIHLLRVMQTESAVPMKDGAPLPPADQPNVKRTRQRLASACNQISKLSTALDDLMDNATARAMITEVEAGRAISSIHAPLYELHDALERASKIEGQKGNQFNPDWNEWFVKQCQIFWADHMDGGQGVNLDSEHESAVSEWVYDLYIVLADFLGIEATEAMLKTATKYHRV